MDVGTLILAGLKKERVLDAVKVVLEQFKSTARPSAPVEDYEAQSVSRKILRIVLSYTDYINRTVWRKSL
jgi:UDP-N-acetylglucosamine 2-epimerase (non-hydrolysing)